jgi:hypothetical protein
MAVAIVVVVILLIIAVIVTLRLRSQANELRQRLILAGPYLIRSGAAFEEIEDLVRIGEWKSVASGGNTKSGRFGNRNSCPCQSEYTVNTRQVVINAWPNPQVLAGCQNNPPPPAAAEWKCKDDCVQVMTHIWQGWRVVRNVRTGQMKFNCVTFAQYHCKKPNDPDRDKPPKPTDPSDPIEP